MFAATTEQAVEEFWAGLCPWHSLTSGRERGWPPVTRRGPSTFSGGPKGRASSLETWTRLAEKVHYYNENAQRYLADQLSNERCFTPACEAYDGYRGTRHTRLRRWSATHNGPRAVDGCPAGNLFQSKYTAREANMATTVDDAVLDTLFSRGAHVLEVATRGRSRTKTLHELWGRDKMGGRQARMPKPARFAFFLRSKESKEASEAGTRPAQC